MTVAEYTASGTRQGPQILTEMRSSGLPAGLISGLLFTEGSCIPLPLMQAAHSRSPRSDALTESPSLETMQQTRACRSTKAKAGISKQDENGVGDAVITRIGSERSDSHIR